MLCPHCSTTIKGNASTCPGCGAVHERSLGFSLFGVFMIVCVAPAAWQGNALSALICVGIGFICFKVGLEKTWTRRPPPTVKKKTYPHQYEHWF